MLLTAVRDRNDNRIALTYDDETIHLKEVLDSAGRLIRVATDDEGHILRFEVKNAPVQGRWITLVAYEYDDKGFLIKATDADGYSAHYVGAFKTDISDGRHD